VKRSLILAVSGLAAMFAGAGAAQADMKVGVVNYNRLMQESPQAKAALDALRNEFAAKQREITNMQATLKAKEERLTKDGPTMSVDQRSKAEKELRDGSRDYQAKATEFQDDVTARQNEETSRLQTELLGIVQNYAAAQKFDLILAEGVIYASSSLDITSAVLATMPPAKAAAAAPGKAPPATK
jgi:outer membrane protein